MRVRWTPPAAADLQNISDYLKEHHPHYRQPTLRKLYQKISALKDAPHIGRPGRVEGTRELLIRPLPYIAVYRVTEQAIEIWRVYHTSQNRP
ncbi:MAG TPA: type II toxin-antitoxin system RelE/ParE family toxin [Bryobacteraceae bacterium]|nr:type II toxin-antitoxin system RelE/ParE family toxin [Bryobacteraceae bacterium]